MGISQLQSSHQTLVVRAHLPGLTPEMQFDYWTKPELLAKWWPEAAEIEPSVGGKYHLLWQNGNTWAMRGVITEYKPGERLGFTWKWDHEPKNGQPRDVRVHFAPSREGGSEVLIEHGPYSDSLEDQDHRDEMRSGWDYFISKLQSIR